MAREHYAKETKETGHLQNLLEAHQVALNVAETELATTRARLSEADAVVVGKGFLHPPHFQPFMRHCMLIVY